MNTVRDHAKERRLSRRAVDAGVSARRPRPSYSGQTASARSIVSIVTVPRARDTQVQIFWFSVSGDR